MNIKFLGQGLSNSKNTVGDILIKSFSNKKYYKFTCYIAFLSLAGVSGLSETIKKSKKHIKEFNVFIGIDNKGTSKEALESILDLDINAKIYHSVSKPIFHPKIYIFEGKNVCRIIVGSVNLTQPGLFQNIEGSIMIDCDNPPSFKGICLRDQIIEYFKTFYVPESLNIKVLTSKLLQFLVDNRLIPNESERRIIYETKQTEGKEEKESNKIRDLFPSTKIPKPPDGFKIIKSATQKKLETSFPPVTILSQKGQLIWKKSNLPPSDVLIERPGTNVTGCLRLVQAGWKEGGVLIDWTKYFRNNVFGNFSWQIIKKKPYEESIDVLFDITILGKNIGQHRLKIRHKPSGEAGQRNYTTSLHWGKISSTIRNSNLKGKTFLLYKPKGNEKEPFYIEFV